MTEGEYLAALKIVGQVSITIDGMVLAGNVDPHLVQTFKDLTQSLRDLVDAEQAVITARQGGGSGLISTG